MNARIFITWLLFIPVPIINGLLRESWYKPKLGEFGSNIIGFAVLSSMFIVYAYFSLRNSVQLMSNKQLLAIGLVWLLLTVIFEFGIGYFAGHSLEYMLANYNVADGKLWPFILLAIAASPFLVKYLY